MLDQPAMWLMQCLCLLLHARKAALASVAQKPYQHAAQGSQHCNHAQHLVYHATAKGLQHCNNYPPDAAHEVSLPYAHTSP